MERLSVTTSFRYSRYVFNRDVKYGQKCDRWAGVLGEQGKPVKFGLLLLLPVHTPTKNHVIPLPQYHWKLLVEHFRTLSHFERHVCRSDFPSDTCPSNELIELFQLGFLSEDMTYSCAIFPQLNWDLTGKKCEQNPGSDPGLKRVRSKCTLPLSPPDSRTHVVDATDINESPHLKEEDPLYAAQIRKLQHIIDKLHIPPPGALAVRVLEIGSGCHGARSPFA